MSLIHLLTSWSFSDATVACGARASHASPDPLRVTCAVCVPPYRSTGQAPGKAPKPGGPVPFRNERAFQQALSQAAQAAGFLYFHPYDSRHSPAGFPDTVLVRDGRLVVAELKMPGQRPTPQQSAWLDALGQVREVSTHLWYPDDLPTILEVLR